MDLLHSSRVSRKQKGWNKTQHPISALTGLMTQITDDALSSSFTAIWHQQQTRVDSQECRHLCFLKVVSSVQPLGRCAALSLSLEDIAARQLLV